MERKACKRLREFRPLALVWLSAGTQVRAAVRFLPETDRDPETGTLMMAAVMLVPFCIVQAPCGLHLALGCRLI